MLNDPFAARAAERNAPTLDVGAIAVEAAAVLFLTTAFVCGLFWRLVVAPGTTLVEPGSDAPGAVGWLYALRHESGYHLFGTVHHTVTGAPFGWDESNALNLQWLIPYYPAYLLTRLIGTLAAFNLVLLSGFVLSGAAMYLLVRYVGCGRLVAGWAALVYIVFPWHLMRVPHPSLVHLEFLPLLLVSLVSAARRPTWSRFALVAAMTLACWLTSGYYGAMAVVTAIAFALGILVTPAYPHRGGRFFVLATASALAGTLIVAVFARAADVGRTTGLNRRVEDVHSWGLHVGELFVPAARNFVFGRWTEPFLHTRQHGSYPVETTNYLGMLTLAFAVAWIVVAWRRRNAVADRRALVTPALAVVLVVAFLFALPGPVSVGGRSVWTPSWLLWQIVPAFRVPARWSIVMMTALVPLAALALQEAAALAARRWRAPAAATVVLLAAAVSFAELGLNPTRSRLSTEPEPVEYAVLARVPPGIVAEYPLVPQLSYFFWQSVHGRRLLNTSAYGSAADDAQHALVNPSTPATAEQLALLGVTAIVTHGDALRWGAAAYRPNPKNWGPGYRLVDGSPAADSTWQVLARPAPALVAAVSGFSAPQALPDGTPAYALVASSGVGYITFRARSDVVVRLSFDAAPPRGKRRVLRLADESHEQRYVLKATTHISIVVRATRGVSLVLVKTDPAPTSEQDAIVLSNVRVAATKEPAMLNAVVQDGDPGF